MIKYKDIVIYGGSSEISKELINLYINECEKLTIFCRDKNMMNFTKRLCLLLPKSRPHDYVVWWQNEVRNSQRWLIVTQSKLDIHTSYLPSVPKVLPIKSTFLKIRHSEIAILPSDFFQHFFQKKSLGEIAISLGEFSKTWILLAELLGLKEGS